uniref:Uncharacterized protein n=1 Tax=Ditylenchus dipsaci TaxID=166011 RepID=A0A915EP92_9BILA
MSKKWYEDGNGDNLLMTAPQHSAFLDPSSQMCSHLLVLGLAMEWEVLLPFYLTNGAICFWLSNNALFCPPRTMVQQWVCRNAAACQTTNNSNSSTTTTTTCCLPTLRRAAVQFNPSGSAMLESHHGGSACMITEHSQPGK